MVLGLIQEEPFYFLIALLLKMFGADMSSSVHANNKTKDILVLGEGLTQGLNDTTLTAEKNIQLILLKATQNFV